jgi:hypothetical protein
MFILTNVSISFGDNTCCISNPEKAFVPKNTNPFAVS